MRQLNLKKRFITLIEVLIALGLTMLLLSTLTFFYHQMSYVNTRMEKVQEYTFQELFLQTRFARIFPSLIAEKATRYKKDTRGDFYFFTSTNQGSLFKPGTQNLIFTYNNGQSLNKSLANFTLGRLFVTPQNQLVLATWPAPSRWSATTDVLPAMKKEVLMDNVENLTFEFYVAPDRNQDAIKKYEKKPAGSGAARSSGSTSPQQPAQQQPPPNQPQKPTGPIGAPPQGVPQPQEQMKSAQVPPVPDSAQQWANANAPQPDQNDPNKAQEAPANNNQVDEGEIKEEKGEDPQPKGSWIKEWKKEYKQLPAMLKIIITTTTPDKEKQTIVYTYPLVNSKQFIIYEN